MRRPLWSGVRWPRAFGDTPSSQPPDPLRRAGQLIRDTREAKGLRLRDLASRTRISIAVLEALERGWRDRLPEATYLRTMLPLLEQELGLPSGSLETVLPHVRHREKERSHRQGLAAAIFAPFTSHVLTGWPGVVLYGLLTLALLQGVNLQQRRLAAMGRLAVSPIPLAPEATRGSGGMGGVQESGDHDALALAFPDLHPLSRAAAGQAKDLLARETRKGGGELRLGLLSLDLEVPTRVDLRGGRGGSARLERLQGEISMPVLPPFELRLTPAPRPAAVRWRGQPLAPRPISMSARTTLGAPSTGVYAVPPAGTPAAEGSPKPSRSR